MTDLVGLMLVLLRLLLVKAMLVETVGVIFLVNNITIRKVAVVEAQDK